MLTNVLETASSAVTDRDIMLARSAAQMVSRQYDDEDGKNTVNVLNVRLNMNIHKEPEEQY